MKHVFISFGIFCCLAGSSLYGQKKMTIVNVTTPIGLKRIITIVQVPYQETTFDVDKWTSGENQVEALSIVTEGTHKLTKPSQFDYSKILLVFDSYSKHSTVFYPQDIPTSASTHYTVVIDQKTGAATLVPAP
jgi:hypothetical protein